MEDGNKSNRWIHLDAQLVVVQLARPWCVVDHPAMPRIFNDKEGRLAVETVPVLRGILHAYPNGAVEIELSDMRSCVTLRSNMIEAITRTIPPEEPTPE